MRGMDSTWEFLEAKSPFRCCARKLIYPSVVGSQVRLKLDAKTRSSSRKSILAIMPTSVYQLQSRVEFIRSQSPLSLTSQATGTRPNPSLLSVHPPIEGP